MLKHVTQNDPARADASTRVEILPCSNTRIAALIGRVKPDDVESEESSISRKNPFPQPTSTIDCRPILLATTSPTAARCSRNAGLTACSF